MSEKIKPEHVQRAAYVSVRQSTAHQVRHHREGQQRQYDLTHRARQLGFGHVVVIDEDLGRSGSGLQERPGFGRLLAAVCQGLAGAVLALEASRLARNNRDWHHLVDLCALADTLIIDDDGIYDPKVLNDRLLLGLKGTMSEFELGLMRQRARQAYLQKVHRGEAMWEVPAGFVRSREGLIEKTPDRQVQQAIAMRFAKFQQLRSARQTLIWLREEQLLVPSVIARTSGQEIRWQAPSLSRVHQVLRNPCYAGAFAFGRTATKTIVAEGRIRRSASRHYRPQPEWAVLILDHHAGYISWAEYLEHREIMAKNLAQRRERVTGAIEKVRRAERTAALRTLRAQATCDYNGCGKWIAIATTDGTSTGRFLPSLGRLKVDPMVAAQVLEALGPAGIEAALQASEATARADQEKRRALELALERARYAAQRAKRQYEAVDPENRLVASELEARWNAALQGVADLEHRVQTVAQVPPSLSAEQKQRLLEWGAELPRLWHDPQAPVELKKQILRTVIQEIVVNSAPGSAEHRLQIHWAGGLHTELVVPRNQSGMHGRQADGKVLELVKELVKVCDDKTMAGVLNRLGYRTGQGHSWSASRLSHFRSNHGLSGCGKRESWVTLEEAARMLEVSHTVVRTLIRKGILLAKQAVVCAPWVIERKDVESPAVQAAARASKRGQRLPPTVAGQQELSI